MADDGTRVCHQCFGDEFLHKKIRRNGAKDECSFCGKRLVTLPLEEIADLFETAIATHYERTPIEPTDMEQAMIYEGIRGWCIQMVSPSGMCSQRLVNAVAKLPKQSETLYIAAI